MTRRVRATLVRLKRQRTAVPLNKPDRVFSRLPMDFGSHSRKLFKKALKKVKMPDDFRIHDLRHLFASNLVQAGVPLSDVAKLLGHGSMTMSMRYASHIPENSAAQAIARLDPPQKASKNA